MKGEFRFTGHLIAVLPVLAAMIFHAITMQRWLLVLPLGCVLLILTPSRVNSVATLGRSVAVGIIGLIVGMTFAVTDVPPVGPIPAPLMSAVTGALIGLASFFAISRHTVPAWICSWLLVAMSASSEASSIANACLVVFLALALIAAAFHAGVFATESRSRIVFPLFVVMVGVATFGFALVAKRLDGVIQNAVEGYFVEGTLPKVTGVGNEILLGSRSSIAVSRQPLFELSEPTGHLRVNVMDRFDGHRWTTSPEVQVIRRSLSEATKQLDRARDIEMVLLDDLTGRLPSPAGTWDVRGAEAYFEGGWVLRGKPLTATLRLTGDRSEQLPAETPSLPGLLDVPDELRSKLESITDELLSGKTLPRDKAESLQRFFQQNFEYSLETNLMGPEHPLIQLVRERRPAYCVYFASAMAVMLRTQGIPARVVSGYLPDETNPLTGRVTVRQRDSHAWVEAWMADEQRFVAFDPTPGRSREQILGTSRSAGFVSALTGAVGSWTRRQWLGYRDDPAGSLLALLLSPITWTFVVCSLVLITRSRRLTRKPSSRTANHVAVNPELKRAYDRYLRSLRTLGITPRPAETDEELLERVSASHDAVRLAKAREFISRYRRCRYRGDGFDEQLTELARL